MDIKKFNKILYDRGMKGLVKFCDTYEEADFLLVYILDDPKRSLFLTKEKYQEQKDNVPEFSIVYYLKHTNPYNKRRAVANFMLRKSSINKR